jgi:hypothetical protein
MKTSELTGAALDWAVAKCEGFDPETLNTKTGVVYSLRYGVYTPSTNWAQGGPIIEREHMSLGSTPDGLCSAYAPEGTRWIKYADKAVEYFQWTYKQQGPTRLIAAMRCYVVSKLGDDVDVPEELCQPTV